jgi:outer membrane receptor for ferrienterochelin and colicins
MKILILGLLLCCIHITVFSQSVFRAHIQNESKEPLPGANAWWKQANKTVAADSLGIITIPGIPQGTHHFTISFAGYESQSISREFPLTGDSVWQVVLLVDEDEEAETVVVTATRTSRTIANTPTRVELITGEELSEKANMKPGDIRMLLTESTGIQTQQTSATSYNAGIRIQGLDGRYTQILRDGYPLYSGFAGGLSILQIAPLDLQQVEVIKGSSSTLYGGGAIAGLVNLVSKTPGKKREASFIANATTALGLDLSAFYSERYRKTGLTVYAARNSTTAYDPAAIGFTAIPKSGRYTINPRLFIYGKHTTADIGVSVVTETRIGGDMETIKHGSTGFFERNNTGRITVQSGIAHTIGSSSTLQLKNSFTSFKRHITIPAYRFDATQLSSFSELTWNKHLPKTQWVVGANLLTDDLKEQQHAAGMLRDYHYNTLGIFVQNAWNPTAKITLESGLRGDFVSDGYGVELLPRVSAMYRISTKTTTRIGGGLGYKTPTVFTEQSERIQFRNLLPIHTITTRNERSVGVNWDINYRTQFGKTGFSFNALLFYTRLNRPLVLNSNNNGQLYFENANGHIDTRGLEANTRLVYGKFKLFIGYTFTDANTHYTDAKSWLPLTSKHRVNNVLMYELRDKWKLGLEGYYYGPQRLTDGSPGRAYWITGFMAERLWEQGSLFINFENFTDTRQSRFGPIYTGSRLAPVFSDIYAPVEGFVINGGIKLRLK